MSLQRNLWRSILILVFISTSPLSSGTVAAEGQNSGEESPPEFPSTIQPGGRHLPDDDDGGNRRVLSAPTCESRGRCSGMEARTTSPGNCFCDALCTYYDDCCEDYPSPSPPPSAAAAASPFDHLPRGVATCQRMLDIETGYTLEVYKVSKCPKDFGDRQVRRLCENEVGPATSDKFLVLPVTGNASLVLYKNIYCAVCAGERKPVFWLGKLRCGDTHLPLNRTSDLRDFIRAACPVDFAPVREWDGMPGAPRRCKSHIGRCDREWTDDDVRQKCRQSTNYVYVGNRTFRNKYCAQCNHVNETYLRCDDARTTTPVADVISDVFFEETASFVVTLDFNRGHAIVTETKAGSDFVAESRVEFPACSNGNVYDPFMDGCRKIPCLPEMEFSAGKCSPHSERTTLRSGELRNASATGEDSDDNDDVTDDDHEVITTAPDAGVKSAVVDTVTVAIQDQPVKPAESMTARFVLFKMESLQHLLSIIAILFCVLALVFYVVLYCMYSALRSDPADRYVVCLAVCLIVAHLLFLFIVLPTEDFPGPIACFSLTVVIQYAYMTAFFWLSVMSIDVFQRLTGDPQTAQQISKQNRCACFSMFSIYAWLVPAVVMGGSTAIAVLKVDGWDQLYDSQAKGCFVLGLSQLLLFILPISLIVTTNVTMYVIITCRICFESRPISKSQPEPELLRQLAKDRKRFAIYVQLTVVMTTTWVMAFVAYFTQLTFLWYVFVAFDVLQGLTLCLAFVWKIKVWYLFNGRSFTITKVTKPAQQHPPSDGVDTPFVVGNLPETSTDDNGESRLDSILRETSI